MTDTSWIVRGPHNADKNDVARRMYCHAIGLVVGVDGDIHNTQVEEDHHRGRALALRGLRVLRFTNDRILSDLPNGLSEIRNAAGNTGASH